MRSVPGYRVRVAVRCSHSCAIGVVARRVGRGSNLTVSTPSWGSMSPLPVRAWRMRGVLRGWRGRTRCGCGWLGGGGVERGDADGVGDQLRLDVQDLLSGVDLAQW